MAQRKNTQGRNKPDEVSKKEWTDMSDKSPDDFASPDAETGDGDRTDRIKRRAHEIWESRGRPEGNEIDHWLEAEREIVARGEAASRVAMPKGTQGSPITSPGGNRQPGLSETGGAPPEDAEIGGGRRSR